MIRNTFQKGRVYIDGLVRDCSNSSVLALYMSSLSTFCSTTLSPHVNIGSSEITIMHMPQQLSCCDILNQDWDIQNLQLSMHHNITVALHEHTSNNWKLDCSFNRSFKLTTQNTAKLRITGSLRLWWNLSSKS